jgi:spore maturation protein CgeB
VKILLVDHYYPAFARQWYRAHPGLAAASYAAQRQSFESAMFGGTAFEVAALRALGHEATVSIINTRPAQQAWAHEHGVDLLPDWRWPVRLRRGFVPWPRSSVDRRWIGQALLAQVRHLQPDVVHVQCMDSIDTAVLPEIRSMVRLVVGQIAAPLPLRRATAGYDLVVSSLPNFVERFRAAGLDSAWLPLAFEPAVLAAIGPRTRDIGVSFVGSIQRSHGSRAELLDAIAGEIRLDVWTPDAAGLPRSSPLRRHAHGEVWGADMYRVLASSRITLNTHIDVAEGYANNLRLYEATGMGALLITDRKVNLDELFDVGREVVAFSDAEDCVAKVRYYVDHPDEAAAIAAAGQARTLRDHTWLDRMARLVAMYEARL